MYKERVTYFENLCKLHKQVLHDAEYNDGDGDIKRRNSFIELSYVDQELNDAIFTKAHFPLVIQTAFRPRVDDTDGAVVRITNTLTFYCKADEAAHGGNKAAAVQDALDKEEKVLNDFVSKMIVEFEAGTCPVVFQDFLFDSVSYSQASPYNDLFFGWDLSFDDRKRAQSMMIVNPENWNEV